LRLTETSSDWDLLVAWMDALSDFPGEEYDYDSDEGAPEPDAGALDPADEPTG